jgi:geranylgeranylglycerol-phosphate geranylgeranyltransferase
MSDVMSWTGVVSRIAATVAIVRPITCLLSATSAACGGYFASGLSLSMTDRGMLSMVSMAGLMGVANAVNDIVDLPADRVGKPRRPLCSGHVSVRVAWMVVATLTILTALSAAALGIAELICAAFLLSLAFAYSYVLKGTVLIGNLVVGAVCGGTMLFGSLVFGRMTPNASLAATVIVLFVVGYEIVKTLQDRDSDAAAGLRTLATTHGPRTSVTAYAVVAAMLCAVAVGIGPLISSTSVACLVFLLLCLILPVCACAWLLHSWQDWHKSAARSLLILRLAWLPGLMSLTFLR